MSAMDVALYGLSKTGTSALFYKLMNSLPPDTICLFEPEARGALARLRVHLKAAVTGAPERGVLAKVLPFRPGRPVRLSDFAGFERQILLVRDPRDRLVSHLLYRVYNSRVWKDEAAAAQWVEALRRKEAEPAMPLTELIATFARLEGEPHAFALWAQAYGHHSVRRPLAFHEARPGIHPMRYEDMVDGRFDALEAYLGFPLSGSSEVGLEVSRIARTRSHGGWRDWFTPEDVRTLGPILQPYLDFYYPGADWHLHATPALDPGHGSRYVEMLVRERRLGR